MTLSPSLLVRTNRRLRFRQWRRCRGVLYAPASRKPIYNQVAFSPHPFGYFNRGDFGSIAHDPARVALVPALFLGCRPAAILWRVGAVHIDAIQRKARRLFAHVCKEVLKQAPPLADCDAARAVVLVLMRRGVVASRSHSRPDPVGGGRPVAGDVPMPRRLLANLVTRNLRAPTGNAPPIQKMGRLREGFVAAVADASPDNPAADSLLSGVGGDQPAEALVGEIDCSRHGCMA